jgi:hypothetical protein
MQDRRICRVEGREADYLLIHQRRTNTRIAPLADPSRSEPVSTRLILQVRRIEPDKDPSRTVKSSS